MNIRKMNIRCAVVGKGEKPERCCDCQFIRGHPEDMERAYYLQCALLSRPVYLPLCDPDCPLVEEGLRDVVERMRGEIERWTRAYPIEMFPKPNLRKARKLLSLGEITLDSVSADSMRHVINRIYEMSMAYFPVEKDKDLSGEAYLNYLKDISPEEHSRMMHGSWENLEEEEE